MCGLVGEAGDLRYQDEFIMKRLLLSDYFRGPDSTGMAAIRMDKTAVVSKLASNPIDLFGMESFKKALNGNASRVFLGHNRLATRGGVSTLNAHPFHIGHIIGAHNGTLDKASVEALEDKLGEKFSVDSMALIASIAKFGIKKTIEMCYKGKTSAEGAWAIVWYNQEEDTINFLRNEHRPLYYSWEAPAKEDEAGFKRLVWASDWWMIREATVASTPGFKIYTKPNTKVGFFDFKEDTHYKFYVPDIIAGGAAPPIPKLRKIKGKEVVVSAVVPFSQTDMWPRETPGTLTGKCGNPKSTTPSTTKSSESNANSRRRLVQVKCSDAMPYGTLVTEEAFIKFYGARCYYCKTDIKYGEHGLTFFERDYTMLCRKCSGYSEEVVRPLSRVYVPKASFSAFAS